MSFADNLQYLRKKNKITQEELAEELNLSRQSISKWETGEAYPETDKLIVLCDKFGVTLDDLLRGDLTKEVKAEEAEEVKAEESEKLSCSECGKSTCSGCNGKPFSKKKMIGAAISSSTMLICAVVYLCLGFTIGLWHPTWLVFLGGIIVCIWSGGMLEDESGKSLKEKVGGLACGTIMVGATLIFLAIGFVCGIWHPTWIAFVIGIGLCGIIGPLTNNNSNGKQ